MRELRLEATDGYPLAASLFGDPTSTRALLVVAGATGVPARFYRRFAEFAAERGVAVVTFDYRGIAASKRGPLRGFEADFLTWAERDLGGVVSWALDQARTGVVGHSFGGHAYGLLPRVNETLGLYTFGTGAGWHGHMPRTEQPKVLLYWRVVGPVVTSLWGYLPSRRLGLGEDLPLGVYRQWRQWCRHPDYWFGVPGGDFAARFARVQTPIVAVNATDDRWAPPRSAAAFLAGYGATTVDLRTAHPATLGVPAIGHMGYFRPSVGARLWEDVLGWVTTT